LLELASYDGGNKTSITDQGVSARCNGKLCRLRPTQRVPRILQTCRRCRHARQICCVTSFVGKAGFSRSGGGVQSHAEMSIPTLFAFSMTSQVSSPPLRLQTLPSSGTCLKDWLANRDHHRFCKLSIVSPNGSWCSCLLAID
jgi:hypothetical protein